ncbi:Pleiotropic regulatory protein [Frankliniella fusca]|uniref:Pleiotropic regulatory protein n=1 Tax=Frankliniella fusca TaxID=407009 RepID=A0AAE1LIV6_9NEOP|nr:Pleiotropic regulatory protein [Frankliniella fusca]
MASELPVDGVGRGEQEQPPSRDATVQADPLDDAQVTYLSTKLRGLERWLLAELQHGRAERRLLEELVLINEEDLEFHRQRLNSLQGDKIHASSDTS